VCLVFGVVSLHLCAVRINFKQRHACRYLCIDHYLRLTHKSSSTNFNKHILGS